MGNHLHTRPKVGGSLTISVSAINADGDRLSDLIEAALPGFLFNLNATAGDITGEFVATLDGTQQTTLANIINGFLPVGYPGESPIIVPSDRPFFFQVNLADYAEIAGDTLEYWNSAAWVAVPRTSYTLNDHARFEASYSPPAAEAGKLYVRFDTDDTKVVLLDHWVDADRNGTDNSNYFVRQTNLSGSGQFRDGWFAPTSDAYVTGPDIAPLPEPVQTMLATEAASVVAVWPFDATAPGVDDVRDAGPGALHGNSSGSDAADFAVAGPNATIPEGMRFQLAGADEHVVLPAGVINAITGTDSKFTILGWFKLNSVTNKDCLFSIGDVVDGIEYCEIAIRTKNSTGAIQGIITNNANQSKLINTIGTYNDGEWHMVALINSASNGRRLRIWTMGEVGENIFSGSTITNSFSPSAAFFGRSAKLGSTDYADAETTRWGLYTTDLTDEQLDAIAVKGGWQSPEMQLDAAVLALGATPQHWKLDDAEGLVFVDSGPKAYDMTQSGGVTADFQAIGPTAILTKAYKFDGVNNRGTVVVTDRPEFVAGNKFSVMLWVDNGGAGQSAKWLFGHYGGGWPWQFHTEGTNDVMADIRNGSDMKRYVIPGVMDGGPHHIAMTFDAGVFKVFKNGAEIVSPVKVSDAAFTTVEPATGPINIGRRDTGSWCQFDGAHAIFVQEVVTPAEIANIYALSGGA